MSRRFKYSTKCRFSLKNPNLIHTVFNDIGLSLRAKGLFFIMVSFYYDSEVTFADIQSKCADSKYVIINAVEELKMNGLMIEGVR